MAELRIRRTLLPFRIRCQKLVLSKVWSRASGNLSSDGDIIDANGPVARLDSISEVFSWINTSHSESVRFPRRPASAAPASTWRLATLCAAFSSLLAFRWHSIEVRNKSLEEILRGH